MIVVTKKSDVELLQDGDQFVVKPKGVDLGDPESLVKHAGEISVLLDAVEQHFKNKKVKTKA